MFSKKLPKLREKNCRHLLQIVTPAVLGYLQQSVECRFLLGIRLIENIVTVIFTIMVITDETMK